MGYIHPGLSERTEGHKTALSPFFKKHIQTQRIVPDHTVSKAGVRVPEFPEWKSTASLPCCLTLQDTLQRESSPGVPLHPVTYLEETRTGTSRTKPPPHTLPNPIKSLKPTLQLQKLLGVGVGWGLLSAHAHGHLLRVLCG